MNVGKGRMAAHVINFESVNVVQPLSEPEKGACRLQTVRTSFMQLSSKPLLYQPPAVKSCPNVVLKTCCDSFVGASRKKSHSRKSGVPRCCAVHGDI